MVGRVGVEPTMFLMCQIYSLVQSPTMHICRYNWKLFYAYRSRFTNLSPPVVIKESAFHSSLVLPKGVEPLNN